MYTTKEISLKLSLIAKNAHFLLNEHGDLYWVIPEKICTPPTDGILEILAGGGVKYSGNPGGRGG